MRLFVLPAALMIAAWLLAPFASQVPASFAGLWEYGPYLSLAIVLTLGAAWRRGRVVAATLVFAAGVLVFDTLIPATWLPDPFPLLVAFIVVPLNVALLGWFAERGTFNVFGLSRLALIAAQFALAYGVSVQAPDWLSVALAFGEEWAAVPVSLVLISIALLCVLVSAAIALVQDSRFAAALTVASAGYVAAVLFPGREGVLFACVIATGLIVIIAMLQDSWRLAYRDDLTGLPSRRALNEMFLTLGGQYSVAMMDVDHFKKFNDTHGHDVGDDVLKLVATQIGRVGGGGRAFRYGGEEFTVVFPTRSKAEATIALEGVRAAIEDYEMVVRAKRDDDQGEGKRGQGVRAGQKTVSVTISIGVAERERGEDPADTLKRADEALYGAKKAGRNRVMAWGDKVPRKRARKAA